MSNNPVTIPRRVARVAALFFVFFMATVTALAVSGDYFTIPVKTQTDVWGVVDGVESKIPVGDEPPGYSFNVVQDGQILGGFESTFKVSDGQAIAVVNVEDSLRVPVLYRPRAWAEIWIDGALAETNEPHLYLYTVAGLWGFTIAGYGFSRVKPIIDERRETKQALKARQ